MRLFDLFAMKAAMLFGRKKASAQLDEELRFHLERQIAENCARDMSPEAARYAALRSFAALACIVPAWLASRVDPAQALRTE